MLTVVAFVVALGLLIAVHEYGHYRMASACGVKVLRFSVGFGKPLCVAAERQGSPPNLSRRLPAGRLVRMLDEREGRSPEERIWPSTRNPCARVPPWWRADLRPTCCWP